MTGYLDVPIFKTIKETAKITNLAEYRIRRIAKAGKVKYILAGKKYLINIDSLINYLKTGDNTTESEKKNGIRRIIR